MQVAILGVKTKMSMMKYRLDGINEGKINKRKHTTIENSPNKIQIDKKNKKISKASVSCGEKVSDLM